MKPLTTAVILSGLALLQGCGLEPGAGVRTWEPSLEVEFDISEGRQAGNGWIRLNNDYELFLETATIVGISLNLQTVETSSGGESATFDPAAPPVGYSLCHNGHCHHDDGRLVDYEEIEAELAAGGGSQQLRTVASLPLAAVDLLASSTIDTSCTAVCELAEGNVARIALIGATMRFEGMVRDSRSPARIDGESTFAYATPAPATIHRSVQISIGLDDPAVMATEVLLQTGPELFDGIDWQPLTAAEMLDLESTTVGDTISTRVAQLSIEVEINNP